MKVAPMLAEFLPISQEFLQIAAARFSELIAGGRKPTGGAAGAAE